MVWEKKKKQSLNFEMQIWVSKNNLLDKQTHVVDNGSNLQPVNNVANF